MSDRFDQDGYLVSPPDDDDPPPHDDRDAPPNVTPIGARKKRSAKRSAKRASAEQRGGWRALLHLTGKDKIASSAANVATILRHDPPWRGVIEYDERIAVPRFVVRPPFPDDLANPRDEYPREATDADLVRIQALFARAQDFAVGLDAISQGLDAVATQRPRDPVREYLDALAWDGTERIERWTSTYLGSADTAYTRGVGARWLISAIARTYRPGCQADHVLVLEGKQGTGKSTALRTLAGPDEFFCDEVQAIGTRDAAESLRGPWIIEMGELDAAQRAEITTLKAFVSRRVDRFRVAYGRRNMNHPRRCVFAATTNEGAYNRDATGARRLWPIRTGEIDVDAIARDRDQLWAEAVVRFRGGAAWWPDSGLEQLAAVEQDARYQGDEWESIVDGYVRGRTEVTVREVAAEALKIEDAKLTQGDQNRIVRALVRLKWSTTGNPVSRLIGGRRQRVRVYTPPPDTPAPEPVPEPVSDEPSDFLD